MFRFLGLQVIFVCGSLLCFLLTAIVLRRMGRRQEHQPETKGGYELVVEQKASEGVSSIQNTVNGIKT